MDAELMQQQVVEATLHRQLDDSSEYPTEIREARFAEGKSPLDKYVGHILPQEGDGSLYNGLTHGRRLAQQMHIMRADGDVNFFESIYDRADLEHLILDTARHMVIRPGHSFGNVDINNVIGSGASGTVYAATVRSADGIFKDPTYPGAEVKETEIALRKNMLTSEINWERYLAAAQANKYFLMYALTEQPSKLKAFVSRLLNGPGVDGSGRRVIEYFARDRNLELMIQRIVVGHQLDTVSNFNHRPSGDFEAERNYFESLLDGAINNVIIDIENKSSGPYVDALISHLGSVLAEAEVTPFVPLYYGSFIALDSDPIKPESAAIPVLVTMVEKYDTSLRTLLEEYEMSERDLFTLFYQVVYGLSALQEHLGFVHNDMHHANILLKMNPPGTHYYYELRPSRVHAQRNPQWANSLFYMRVPAPFKISAIDFGRASLLVDKGISQTNSLQRVESDVAKANFKDFDTRNPNNDLIKFVGNLIITHPEYIDGSREDTPFSAWVKKVLTDANGVNLYDKITTNCKVNPRRALPAKDPELYKYMTDYALCPDLHGAEKIECGCKHYHRWFEPFRENSGYFNGVPAHNIADNFMSSEFMIDRSEIPPNAPVHVAYFA